MTEKFDKNLFFIYYGCFFFFERFIVQIEELINEWKLNSSEQTQETEDFCEDAVNFFYVGQIYLKGEKKIFFLLRSTLKMASGPRKLKQFNLQMKFLLQSLISN